MEFMKKITTLLYFGKMSFKEKMAYMQSVWFDLLGMLVAICLYFSLWQAVFKNSSEINGFSPKEIVVYVILSQILNNHMSNGINMELSSWIYQGKIDVELMRPISLIENLFGKRMGEFAFFYLAKGLPVFIISMVMLNGEIKTNFWLVIIFVVMLFLAMCITFYFDFLIGLCGFYTMNSYGLKFSKDAILSFLAGGIIPLAFFPEIIQNVLIYLPFASMVSVPVNCILGKYTFNQILGYLILQIMWIFILSIISKAIYKRVILKVNVQGG